LTEAQSTQISKRVWGNKPKASTPKKQPSRAGGNGGGGAGLGARRLPPADQETKAREFVRPLVRADLPVDYNKVGKQLGLSHVTVEKATRIERVLLHEPQVTVDIDTMSPSAKQKLDAAVRQEKRKLDAEHATRMHGVNEEVRLRVLAEGKEYLAMVKEREAKVQQNEQWWQEVTNSHKPLFTADQFKTILMCLHPDGHRTADKLAEAFRLFNGKKVQLTGARS
jgi:hypothetical protein